MSCSAELSSDRRSSPCSELYHLDSKAGPEKVFEQATKCFETSPEVAAYEALETACRCTPP